MKKISILFSLVFLLLLGIGLSSCGNSIDEFRFEKDNYSIEVGEEVQISNISNETGVINFFSSDETVVKVDNTGKALGVGRGSATIYALFKNEPYRCNIRVTASTTNPDSYQKNVLLCANMKETGLDIILPGTIKYNGKDSLISFDESFKVQLEFDLLKAKETKNGDTVVVTESEQVVNNLKTIEVIAALSIFASEKNSDSYKQFLKVIDDTLKELKDLSGSELDSKIKELKDLTFYAYISMDYMAMALISNGELKAFSNSNAKDSLLYKTKKLLDNVISFINSGTDLQKIDYIEITKSLTGDILTSEQLNNLKKYQDIIGALVYVILGDLQINKQAIEEGKPDQRITLTVLEDGINKINDTLSKKTGNLSLIEFKELKAIIDVTKDNDTNYNDIKKIEILGNLSFIVDTNLFMSIELDKAEKLSENPYIYESKHSEFEKQVFTN